MSSYLDNIIEIPIQNSSESYRLGSSEMNFPEQCICKEMTIRRRNEGYIVIPGIARDYKIKKSSLTSNHVVDIKSNSVPMNYP